MEANQELSAYERERHENIRSNNRVLADLGLGPAPSVAPSAASSCSKLVAPRRSKHGPTVPGRVSSRLAAIKLSELYVVEEAPNGSDAVGGDVERAKDWMKHHHFSESKSSVTGATALEGTARDPLTDFRAGYMPKSVDDLLEGEVQAYEAVYEAVRLGSQTQASQVACI